MRRHESIEPILDKFVSPEPTSGCWLWTGHINSLRHYGYVGYQGKLWHAHRLVYTLLVGPIPKPLTVDHKCRTRSCVNPAHLRLLTNRENWSIGFAPTAINARKIHCDRGHSLTNGNVRIRRGTTTHRVCRACERERSRRRRGQLWPRM